MRQPQKTSKRKTRAELNEEGRERKRQKKHRGNQSGSRANGGLVNKQDTGSSVKKDPRVGSKTPVPLIVEDKKVVTRPVAAKPAPEVVKPTPALAPEKELALLENDDRLDALLERLDNDERLSKEEQAYVEKTLDRIDELMEMLGIELGDDDDDLDSDRPENILHLLKQK